MPTLATYAHFAGRHWETGTVHNYLADRGFLAPHTRQPYSEALLLGISGGATMGYFSFAYDGYDPHVTILTRNTFDPLETLLARLGVEQTLRHTDSPSKAVHNLIETLDDGLPALVWADHYTLPYNALPLDPGMWAMLPVLVYGYDEAADQVWLADRAEVPLVAPVAEFAAARARVKQIKHRQLTLELPNPDKLANAVYAGISDCIKLYSEAPPKGAKHNFGLAAYEHWAKLLTKPKQRHSWEQEFPRGAKFLAGLTSAFTSATLYGQDGAALDADRGRYADFLDEASVILAKPGLREAAQAFRRSGAAWRELALALLPDSLPPLGEIRQLHLAKHPAFIAQGNAGLHAMQQAEAKLAEIKKAVADDFPLRQAEVVTVRQELAARIMALHDLEQQAVVSLQAAML